jgi:tetratricopeptide (TPR) repeat protein
MRLIGNRWAMMVIVALALIAGASLLAPAVAQQEPRQPLGDSTALLASGTTAVKGYADSIIAETQIRLTRDPADHAAHSRLGIAYLQKARETNDPSYYTQAERSLQKALNLKPDSYDATAAMGSLELSRHNFSAALDWGSKATALNPYKAYGYGVRGDAQIELGRYEEAVGSFQKMVDLRPDLSSYSRVSYARELYGDSEGAIEAMRQAVTAGSPAAENTAWCRVQLGNLLFNSKKHAEAEVEFRRALAAYPGYLHALAGLAQVEAARGETASAIRHYKEAVAEVPLPQYLAALGDLYASVGDDRSAAEQYDLVLYIYRTFEVNGVDAGPEKAAFLTDLNRDIDEAVKLAQAAASVRSDVHTQDTLGWALYRAGRYEEALQAEKSAMRLGTQNPLFFFHLGMIYEKLGDHEGVRQNLQRALAINPHFNLKYAQEAVETLKKLQ